MAVDPAMMWLAALAGIVTDSAQKETGWAVRSGNWVLARMVRSTAGAAGVCAAAATARVVTPISAVAMTERTVISASALLVEAVGDLLALLRDV
jgi:hypothetical protein